MGRKKENLEELKRENPAENNWEIEDQDSGIRMQDSGTRIQDAEQVPEVGRGSLGADGTGADGCGVCSADAPQGDPDGNPDGEDITAEDLRRDLMAGLEKSKESAQRERLADLCTAEDFGGINIRALKVLERLENLTGAPLMVIAQVLLEVAVQKVDPELRKDKVIEHWALADDHATFIFDDGSKVRVSL